MGPHFAEMLLEGDLEVLRVAAQEFRNEIFGQTDRWELEQFERLVRTRHLKIRSVCLPDQQVKMKNLEIFLQKLSD